MLIDVLRILVLKTFLETFFYGERKKVIDFFKQFFYISYKNNIKTFLK